MVTGVPAEEKLEQAFSAGATDYILKPANPVEMIARIGSALNLKEEMERRKSGYVSDLEEKNRELELAFMELEKKNQELEEASRAKTQILPTAFKGNVRFELAKGETIILQPFSPQLDFTTTLRMGHM